MTLAFTLPSLQKSLLSGQVKGGARPIYDPLVPTISLSLQMAILHASFFMPYPPYYLSIHNCAEFRFLVVFAESLAVKSRKIATN
jgi:hypothetical protein